MILISGGLGYLGGRIAKYLLDSGFKVKIGSSRDSPHIPVELSSCEVVLCDLFDIESLEIACKGVSAIIHLASLNAKECNDNPTTALLINGLGTLKLLDAAKSNNVAKFIYFSTAHVYGYPLAGEISENSATQPAYNYAITHKLAEDYVLKESLNGSIKGTIFRLTNGVGSPINKEANCWMLVVNDLCKQVVLNHKMKLHSHKLTQRDFVAITEVCSIVSHALVDDMLNNEIINISSGVSLTLEELTSIIADESSKLFDFRPEVDFRQSLNFEHIEKLSISSKKLKNFGYCINSDLSNEIRNLLINCQNWFL
ncbi:SDR family oxidoreductase [Candidatus Woesearchaeota archaeon]|jgi:UDP-glucose 4-epimerase|nr:SDR family oxidoreductase [Candidatus Woesearchaeota archaeon]